MSFGRCAAMEAAIVKRLEGRHPNSPTTFQFATTVLNLAAPPTLRAALFRMLATLPDVRCLGKVTDPLADQQDSLLALGLVTAEPAAPACGQA